MTNLIKSNYKEIDSLKAQQKRDGIITIPYLLI